MKRLGSSESLVPIYPSGWLQDEEEEMVDGSLTQASEKKRRLGADQVKALEKNFEVENKLEPERKARLAQELGLQPRQVAIWFQNRRARWKTKQLERDYGVLKSKYDALRAEYEAMVQDRDSLLAEVKSLKAKLAGGEEESFSSIIKEEAIASESDDKSRVKEEEEEETETVPLIYKDGSSDSDSSGVLNDHETSPLISFTTTTNPSLSSPFFCNQNILKIEDDDEFLVGDEPCSSSFFHDEQAPTLSWYCGGGWDQETN